MEARNIKKEYIDDINDCISFYKRLVDFGSNNLEEKDILRLVRQQFYSQKDILTRIGFDLTSNGHGDSWRNNVAKYLKAVEDKIWYLENNYA